MERANDRLQTPKWVYEQLGPFDLDPCAGDDTAIAKINYRLKNNECGLQKDWKGFVWCNPPFSQKQLWINKMVEHGNGFLLLPERGSAPWFGPLAEITGSYFVMGRKINFLGGASSNNVGSVIFPFGFEAIYRLRVCRLPGHFVKVDFYNRRLA